MGNQDGKWGFSMFMSEAITEFGFDCKIRKLSSKTITNYQKQLKYLQRYLESEFGVKKVDAIKSIHIKQFLAMKDYQGRKARYINDLLKVFKTFFNYMKKEAEERSVLRLLLFYVNKHNSSFSMSFIDIWASL